MWMSVNYTRELNILSETIVQKLNITSIEKQIYIKDEDDIFFDLFHEDLYTFSMNGKDYEEYISKTVMSNWNSEHNTISFKEIGTDSETTLIYINQWGGCPNCKEWHSKQDSKSNLRICLNCWVVSPEDDFN